MKKSLVLSTLCWIFASATCASVHAEQLPLWEAGLGVAGISFPDYRGADERQYYLLPMPYLVYRGEFLKADRQRVRIGEINRNAITRYIAARPEDVDRIDRHAAHFERGAGSI